MIQFHENAQTDRMMEGQMKGRTDAILQEPSTCRRGYNKDNGNSNDIKNKFKFYDNWDNNDNNNNKDNFNSYENKDNNDKNKVEFNNRDNNNKDNLNSNDNRNNINNKVNTTTTTTTTNNNNANQRKRNVIWFNPLFSKNVATSIGRYYFSN